MYILAIDTAANLCSLSIWTAYQKLHGLEQEISQGHSAILAPLCQQLLFACNLSLRDINQILVNTGPGSFTGIRVGMAFAKGLASSANIPLRGVNAFDAAYWSQRQPNLNTLIVLDARRKDFYCQQILEGEKQAPTSMNREQIHEILEKQNSVLIGNGAAAINSKHSSLPPHWRGADSLIVSFYQGISQLASPYYLREPDVAVKSC